MEALSIIIPSLNEEAYLCGLLEAIRQQTRPPLEIIVADAGSSDRTVKIALQAGCRVVPGGRPAAWAQCRRSGYPGRYSLIPRRRRAP